MSIQISEKNLQKLVTQLDKSTLALKFYLASKDPRYIDDLQQAIEKLYFIAAKEVKGE